jgi:hypothetical protein
MWFTVAMFLLAGYSYGRIKYNDLKAELEVTRRHRDYYRDAYEAATSASLRKPTVTGHLVHYKANSEE